MQFEKKRLMYFQISKKTGTPCFLKHFCSVFFCIAVATSLDDSSRSGMTEET